MLNCETEIGNRIFVHCNQEKCEMYRTCKKKYHHVWYKKKCSCGKEFVTENPTVTTCSYHCTRHENKRPTKKGKPRSTK